MAHVSDPSTQEAEWADKASLLQSYRETLSQKNEQKTQGGGGKDRKVRNIPKDTGIKTPTLWIWEAWERETRKGAALDSAGEERRSVTFRPLLFFF